LLFNMATFNSARDDLSGEDFSSCFSEKHDYKN